jgi:hypothetical protein
MMGEHQLLMRFKSSSSEKEIEFGGEGEKEAKLC